jgi:hypothetical protein
MGVGGLGGYGGAEGEYDAAVSLAMGSPALYSAVGWVDDYGSFNPSYSQDIPSGRGINLGTDTMSLGKAATLADVFGRNSTLGSMLGSPNIAKGILGLMPGPSLATAIASGLVDYGTGGPLGGTAPETSQGEALLNLQTQAQYGSMASQVDFIRALKKTGSVAQANQAVSGKASPTGSGSEGLAGYNFDTELEKLANQIAGSATGSLAIQQKYLDELESVGLSPEELADFDAQYQKELEALVEDFDLYKQREGARQIAELTDRGMLESTTGQRAIAETEKQFADILMGAKSDILQSKETAKEDLLGAKEDLARAKYSIASGMTQQQINTALQASMALQNYYLSQSGAKANSALTGALAQQAQEKAKYDQRSELWSTVAGIGGGLLKSGITGLFN